uniref:Bee-milk protein n=1 Tax=Homalodisca liturata TaxID=320908 RepID=A0A1B6HAH0_9HEMI
MRSCGVLMLLVVASCGAAVEEFRVVYEWFKLDFEWQNSQAKFEAYARRMYNPKNNIIQNIKIWEETAFLTLPRSKSGVPATLVTVSSVPMSNSASPRLQPFPSWSFQEVGDCSSLQNVQAIEIDPDGFLWVADSGTIEELREFGEPDNKCPPKLVIFDIKKRELVSEFEFSRELLRPASILTDIVIDPRGNKTAYISAVNDFDASIIVYKNETKSAIKVEGLPRVKPTSVIVNGTEVPLKLNKLSLALSVWQETLYFNPSWEEMLYSVKVQDLQSDVSSFIKPIGSLQGLSYALILDSKQNLYYTILEKDSLGKWNTSRMFEDFSRIITEDNSFLQFPSSFAFDASENLWVLSNRFQTYLNGDVNLEVPNFRLIRAYTRSNSYMYAPQPASSAKSIASTACFVILLVLVALR